MTEIDFDELDKAVNSLMADTSTPKTSPSSDNSVDESRSSTPTETAQNSSSATKAPLSESKPAAPPLATKRRGQFMDIVRPTATKSTSFPTHRQGVTIAPASSIAPTVSSNNSPARPVDEVAAIVSVEPFESTSPQDASEKATESSSQNSEVTTSSQSEWPDPIEFAATEQKQQETTAVESTQGSSERDVSPLESPFLPDAKPEKRPLDALAAGEESTAVEQQGETEETEATFSETTKVDLPAELHTSVMAIESESTAEPDPTPESVAISPSMSEEKENVTDSESVVSSNERAIDVPAGGSIPQQYQEQPNTGDQTNGSIYDTANYHKAIEAHATGGRKSSVAKMIVWGILLLVLGVGIGAGAFILTR